ncbi:MAG: hypothetical protein RID18_02735 [Cytophagales bacterium]|jgi:hypothetical protein|tara:strand:- start:59 stop:196 length:138 start_codon:yes stop_codon:yes gene_type:complete
MKTDSIKNIHDLVAKYLDKKITFKDLQYGIKLQWLIDSKAEKKIE